MQERDDRNSGLSTLRFISSEDEGYTVEYTLRDKNGRFTTETKTIPPMTLITSTIRVMLDEQFERRAWIFNPDESEEQTARIREFKVKNETQEFEKEMGFKKYTDTKFAITVLREFVNCLEDVVVLNPIPNATLSLLSTKLLRVRGDYDKVLGFLNLYGKLNNSRLPSVIVNDKRIVVLTPKIISEALKLMRKPFALMSTGIQEKMKELLDVIKDFRYETEEIDKGKREQLALKLRKTEKTVRDYLKKLVALNYVSERSEGKSHEKTYTFLKTLDEIMVGFSSLEAQNFPAIDPKFASLEAKEMLSSLEKNGCVVEHVIKQILDELGVSQKDVSAAQVKFSSEIPTQTAPINQIGMTIAGKNTLSSDGLQERIISFLSLGQRTKFADWENNVIDSNLLNDKNELYELFWQSEKKWSKEGRIYQKNGFVIRTW